MAHIITGSRGYIFANSSGSDIAAGDAVVNGTLFGFAAFTIKDGENGWIETTGVWAVDCGNTESASVGDVAYWDASNKKATATASTNLPIGYFVKAVANGQTVCEVALGVGAEAVSSGSGSGSGG